VPHSLARYVFGNQTTRLAALAFFVILGSVQADPVSNYAVTQITGFIPSGYSSAVDDLGQIAGSVRQSTDTYPFSLSTAGIWSNGAVTLLGTLPATTRVLPEE